MKTAFRDRDIATLTKKVNFWAWNVHKNTQEAVEDTTLSVHTHAVQNVAVKRGDLKRDIRFKIGRLAGLIVAGSEDVPYAGYVEFGTTPHVIEPRNASLLRFKDSSGNFVFAKRVNHPGTQAQPFMSPAAEANRRRHARNMKAAVKKSKTGGTKATAPKAPLKTDKLK